MARSDDIGFFWEDRQTKAGKYDLPLAAIPETGWRPPEFFPDLSAAEWIAVDTETHDPDLLSKGPGPRRDGYMVGVSIGVDTGERWYFPIAHKLGGNLPRDAVLAWLNDNLSRPNQPKIGANLSYDIDYLETAGVHVEGPFYDVQVAEPLLDELAVTYSLDVLAHKHLNEGKVDEALYLWCSKSYGGKPTREDQAKNIWRAPVQLVGPYAEGDVDLPMRVFKIQKKKLEEQNLWNTFIMESDLIPMLVAMRRRGVAVNLARADEFYATATMEASEKQKSLGGISVNSPEDIVRLCKKEGIVFPRTAAGNPSFQKAWLEAHPHPAMKAITEIRSLYKLRDTFVKGYIQNSHVNGRIHCQFNQLRSDTYGTVSGRFSSSNPNLQNIPTRTTMGKLIRAMFEPDGGEDWNRFDWSQIEFRLLTHYAIGGGAEEARVAYRDNPTTDFHQWVADTISKVVSISRSDAKNINFGFVYGMGVEKLAKSLGISLDEAQEILDGYHKAVPFVRKTSNAVANIAKQRGHIITILKRHRHYPDPDFTFAALNGLLQGGAADVMKRAMQIIWKSGVCSVLGAPLLTVHDELDWSVPRTKEAHEAMLEVHQIMQTCVKLKIPLLCEREVGANWGSLKKYKLAA